jgi:hypothetical protein
MEEIGMHTHMTPAVPKLHEAFGYHFEMPEDQ